MKLGKTHNVLDELRTVASDCFDCLKYVDLAMLDYLFDAGIGSAVHSSPRLAITVGIGKEKQ